MKNVFRLSTLLMLAWLPLAGFSQEPEIEWVDLTGELVESTMDDSESTTLILDNSRTKVGKDFYDLFYKNWSSQPTVANSLPGRPVSPAMPADEVIITIEETPSPGSGHLIQISMDDQPVWQQFVQGRYDLLEIDATQAVAAIRSRGL
ncbi:CsgE family curli-type amyloid fiber assembly protein [Larkinella sp. GY13]|uniref:CsgE family curli-type amyloid fiber assembly protein n=1 Tax=Larkinella sp. GY13 TaxID=3453720 RepID=UPI003EECD6F7